MDQVPSEADVSWKNHIVLPGLINSHVHVGDGGIKDTWMGLTLDEIVGSNGIKMKYLSRVSLEQWIKDVGNSLDEMLLNGITTFVDFREGGIEGINALRRAMSNRLGPRAIILGRKTRNETFESIIDVADGYGIRDLFVHALDELIHISKKCKQDGKICAIHVGEDAILLNKSKEIFGTSDFLIALEKLNPRMLIHLTHVTESELVNLKEDNWAVFCPGSNMFTRVGYPPIDYFLRNELPFLLGTDNLLLNPPDLFKELGMILKMSCLNLKNVNPVHLLKAVTVFAGKALKQPIGSIIENNFADLLVLKIKPRLYPLNNVHWQIVSRATPGDIAAVYVGGKNVLETKGHN